MLKSRKSNYIYLHFKNIIFYTLLIFLAAFVILRDAFGVSIPKVFLIALATGAMLIADKSDLLCCMGFIVPFAKGIPYAYVSGIAFMLLILKSKKLRVNAVGLISIFSILLIELFAGLFYTFDVMLFVRFSGVFLICVFRMIDYDESYDCRKMMNFFCVGFLVALLSLWGQMLARYSIQQLFVMGFRFGDTRELLDMAGERMVVSYNQNELASLCLLTFWVSYRLFQETGKKWYIAFSAFAVVHGFLTQSRMFVLVMALSFVVIFLSQLFSKKNWKSVLALLAVFILAFVLLRQYFWEYIDNLMLRFKESDLTGNRVNIMREYFGLWDDSVRWMILGAGLQNYSKKYGLSMSAHNSTQEILLTWGIIGLIFVILLLTSAVFVARKKMRKTTFISYVPFFVYILVTQSAQGFYDLSGIMRLMISYCLIMLPISSSGENDNMTTLGGTEE